MGITFIEGLLVISVFTASPSVCLLKHRDETLQFGAQVQIKSYMIALYAYKLDTGSFPTSEAGLPALWRQPEGVSEWRGPYLTGEARDPWDRAYIYRFPGEHGDLPDIVSYGADGKVGGEGSNRDIVSWQNR